MGNLLDKARAGFVILLFAVSTSAHMVLSKASLFYLPAPACLHLMHMLTSLLAVWAVSSTDVLDLAVEPLSVQASGRAGFSHLPPPPPPCERRPPVAPSTPPRNPSETPLEETDPSPHILPTQRARVAVPNAAANAGLAVAVLCALMGAPSFSLPPPLPHDRTSSPAPLIRSSPRPRRPAP